jgi:hypothetical protein
MRTKEVVCLPHYELDDGAVGVRFPVGLRMFISPYRLDRLWGPHSLLRVPELARSLARSLALSLSLSGGKAAGA